MKQLMERVFTRPTFRPCSPSIVRSPGPGHASLVRTVVGGSHIIDMMMLVVDITKGIQPQTAECIVIGELMTEHLIVVLNKVDLVSADKRSSYVKKASKLIRKTLEGTCFAGAGVVPATTKEGDRGVDELVAALGDMAGRVASLNDGKRKRDDTLPFMMHIDHCFAIKGQGTVVTGTISAGTLSVGQTVSLPHLGLERKVKSIQAFKKSVAFARSGDRVGVCLANVNAASIERGLACAPGSVVQFSRAVARVSKVRFYADRLISKKKLHMLIGHASVMGTVEFFGVPRVAYAVRGVDPTGSKATTLETANGFVSTDTGSSFSFENEYVYQDELYGHEGRHEVGDDGEESRSPFHGPQWALITFAEPIISRPGEMLLGAKLDAPLDSCSCRIAMKGVLDVVKVEDREGASRYGGVKLFKTKTKRGMVDKLVDSGSPGPNNGRTTIVTASGLFGPNSVMTKFLGMHCVCVRRVREGETEGRMRKQRVVPGRLESKFGSQGQCRIVFAEAVQVGDSVLLSYRKMLGTGDMKQ